MQLAVSHLLDHVEVVDALSLAAASIDDTLAGNSIDMLDAWGCLFMVRLGTQATGAVGTVKVMECETADGSFTAVTGATVGIVAADDDVVALVDVCRPAFVKKFINVTLVRATGNLEVDAGLAVKYGMNAAPVTQAAQALTTAPAAGATKKP